MLCEVSGVCCFNAINSPHSKIKSNKRVDQTRPDQTPSRFRTWVCFGVWCLQWTNGTPKSWTNYGKWNTSSAQYYQHGRRVTGIFEIFVSWDFVLPFPLLSVVNIHWAHSFFVFPFAPLFPLFLFHDFWPRTWTGPWIWTLASNAIENTHTHETNTKWM